MGNNSNSGKTGNKAKKKISIKLTLVTLAVCPALVASIIILLFARYNLTQGMNAQACEGMAFMAEAVEAGFEDYQGAYSLNSSGELLKGNVNLSQQPDIIDKYVEENDADVTICFGKTRKITTLKDASGNRIVGTDISDEAWNTVQKGEVYETDNIKVNGEDYVAAYVPIKDASGKVIGTVFAGEPKKDVDAFISSKITVMILVTVVVLILIAVIGFIAASRVAKSIEATEKVIMELSNGNLTVQLPKDILKRRDEIGNMARAAEGLVEKLRSIIEDLLKSANTLTQTGDNLDTMADQSNKASEEISSAVEDISKGAVAQAEEIQTASTEIAGMGQLIEGIVENVGSLTNATNTMGVAGDTSMKTMDDLSTSNDKTTSAIKRISDQLEITNQAVAKISDAASLITNITDQTSLLALNASIESARAGEAGKGFAVVATEIQKLAAQSDEAASEIQEIIATLQDEAAKTLQAMQETESLVNEQQMKLGDTKKCFGDVSSGIAVTRKNTDVIRGTAASCDGAREQINDVISNLSAISEQNAASAQQTTASMQELNATINIMAATARDLKEIAVELNESMTFFKL